MTTIHDLPTMAYPIARPVADTTVAEPALDAESRSFLKALTLIVLAVGVIGAAIVVATAFLVFPPPAHTTVVRPDAHPAPATQVVTPTPAALPGS